MSVDVDAQRRKVLLRRLKVLLATDLSSTSLTGGAVRPVHT